MITPLDKRHRLTETENQFFQAVGIMYRTAKEGGRCINLNDIKTAHSCFIVGDLREFTMDVLLAETLLRQGWTQESSP